MTNTFDNFVNDVLKEYIEYGPKFREQQLDRLRTILGGVKHDPIDLDLATYAFVINNMDAMRVAKEIKNDGFRVFIRGEREKVYIVVFDDSTKNNTREFIRRYNGFMPVR